METNLWGGTGVHVERTCVCTQVGRAGCETTGPFCAQVVERTAHVRLLGAAWSICLVAQGALDQSVPECDHLLAGPAVIAVTFLLVAAFICGAGFGLACTSAWRAASRVAIPEAPVSLRTQPTTLQTHVFRLPSGQLISLRDGSH